ncbi:MAG: FAD-dependent oxidoreductase [bacterium]
MPIALLKGKIILKEQIAADTYRVQIAADTKEFLPGQFLSILVADKVYRSYSISSIPGLPYYELIADTVHHGPGSLFFINSQVGDEVTFLGPLGRFLYEDGSDPVYFFATGTGVVPFLAMIRHALVNLNSKRKITLFIGFRFADQIFYLAFLEKLAIQYPNFQFILSLTRPDDSWQGKKGRIYEHFDLIEHPENSVAYLCGSRDMVQDLTDRLEKLGFQKERIHFEKF